MTSINKILNEYLGNKRIEKNKFDDLSLIIETVGFDRKILDWFTYLQSIETVGWRPSKVTRKIAHILVSSDVKKPLKFYTLLCPSYKKGV